MESVLEAFRVLKKKSKMTWTLSSSSCGGSASGHRGLVLMDGASGWGGESLSSLSVISVWQQLCRQQNPELQPQPSLKPLSARMLCCSCLNHSGAWRLKGKKSNHRGSAIKNKKNHEQALILQTSSLLYTFTQHLLFIQLYSFYSFNETFS